MVRKGVVKKLLSEKAWVQVFSEKVNDGTAIESSCSCSSCSGCHTRQDLFLVDTDIPLQLDDRVELHLETHKLILTAFITFLSPVLFFIFSLWLTRNIDHHIFKWSLILLFLAFSLLIAYIFDKHNKAKVRVVKILDKEKVNE